MNCKVLVVDDDDSLQYTFRELLTSEGYEVRTTGDPFDGLKLLGEYLPHIVILDLSMPKMSGLELLERIKKKAPTVVCIMVTAHGTEEIAVRAIKAGADDYFSKPFANESMLLTLRNARDRLLLADENRQLRLDLESRGSPEILGSSPRTVELMRMIDQVAATDVTVLILGESGTGKELVASTLCRKSKRAGRPFVKLNCAALPENLIESELFGYEAGAFTGAQGSRKGRFETAHSGTIFLDEIGDMTLSTQTKVLRVLQEREVERLGGGKTLPVDVRVICATHRNLEDMISKGQFREDLYYRLNVVTIPMPALRERGADIALLARHFARILSEKYGRPLLELSDELLSRMLTYPWPGNVRELENAIARGVVLGDPMAIVPRTGPAAQAEDQLMGDLKSILALTYKDAKRRVLDRFERYYLLNLMEVGHGNVSRAARAAGMDRKNFWVKVKSYLPDRGSDAGADDFGDEEDE